MTAVSCSSLASVDNLVRDELASRCRDCLGVIELNNVAGDIKPTAASDLIENLSCVEEKLSRPQRRRLFHSLRRTFFHSELTGDYLKNY
jgi:hypothetical protein